MLSNQERQTLVRHGKKLGARIKELFSIVSYSTFRKWVRSVEYAPPPPTDKRPQSKTGKSGRPRAEESISNAIIRIRKETNRGYTKILQAMRRLGHKISRQTLKNVLVASGLSPAPQDHPNTWSEFLRRHAATLCQCDFACKRKWTIRGKIEVYFLVFTRIGSRRIWISPFTEHPPGDWTMQQVHDFSMHLEDEGLPCGILCRDNDTMYMKPFDDVLKSMNIKIKRTASMSPNLQAHVERVIQTIKHEVLNAFCVVSNAHLDQRLRLTQDCYNHRRGHSARDHLAPIRESESPPTTDLSKHRLVCVEELGGHVKYYKAAA